MGQSATRQRPGSAPVSPALYTGGCELAGERFGSIRCPRPKRRSRAPHSMTQSVFGCRRLDRHAHPFRPAKSSPSPSPWPVRRPVCRGSGISRISGSSTAFHPDTADEAFDQGACGMRPGRFLEESFEVLLLLRLSFQLRLAVAGSPADDGVHLRLRLAPSFPPWRRGEDTRCWSWSSKIRCVAGI
jgi:hypothetical protein